MELADNGRRVATLFGATALCAAIYLIDAFCTGLSDPDSVELIANIALPLDLMVVAPLAFWLVYIRPRGKSSILALPVIYLGGAASAAMSVGGQFTLVPYLLLAAAAVDAVVLYLEIPGIARKVKTLNNEARRRNLSPLERFRLCSEGVMGKSTPARMLAMELTMWWYLFRSWGKLAHCEEGCTAFSYHKESNATALTVVIVFLSAIEMIVAHIALSKVSVALAITAALATSYALAWLVANARAVVLSPILVGQSSVLIRWGFLSDIRFDRSNVKEVVIGEFDAPKTESVDLSSLGGSTCWVILKEPVGRRSLTGKVKMVRYVKVSPDNAAGFKRALREPIDDELVA